MLARASFTLLSSLLARKRPPLTAGLAARTQTSRQFDCLERLRDTDEVQAMLDPTLKIDVSLEVRVLSPFENTRRRGLTSVMARSRARSSDSSPCSRRCAVDHLCR